MQTNIYNALMHLYNLVLTGLQEWVNATVLIWGRVFKS